MEYSVSDLIRILLKRWYVVLLVMAILGGAAGVLSQRSYQSALAEYEAYTTRTVPVNQETGDLVASYQCDFSMQDMSRYRERAASKNRFIEAYLAQDGVSSSDARRYQEAENAYAAANADFLQLFTQESVLAEVQAFAAGQGYDEPVVVQADGTVSEAEQPLQTAEHFQLELDSTGLLTVSITGLSEDMASALLTAYWQAVEEAGMALYDMQISAEPLTRVYVPQKLSLTEDAILSQTVMQKPERAPMFLRAVGKGAAFGFLFGCFGVLLYTFIRDTAPEKKPRRAGESVG